MQYIVGGEFILSKICKQCSKEMPDEASVCLYCFNEYGSENENAVLITEKKPSRINKKEIMAIAAALALVLVTLPAVISYTYGDEAPIDDETVRQTESSTQNGFKDPLDNLGVILGNEVHTSGDNNGGIPDEPGTIAESMPHENSNTFPHMPGYNNQTTTNLFPEIPGTTAPPRFPNNSTTIGNTTRPFPVIPSQPTTKPPVTTTKPPTTEGTTASSEKPVFIAKDFEYEPYGKGLVITKYKGKSKDVLIPDKIDGKTVLRIEQNSFNGNNYVQTVTFEDSDDYHILTVNYQAFHDCPSLKKIKFPRNTDLAVLYMFAYNCTSLVDIDISHWQYKFEKGMLYYDNTQSAQYYYYCEGCRAESWTQPKNVSAAIFPEEAFANNKYLKRIYLNGDYCIAPTERYPYLEGIYANGTDYFDVDGVMFKYTDSGSMIYIYPEQKKDKTFTYPENCHVSFYQGGLVNKYVETFVIPNSVTFYNGDIENINYKFSNLKTVKIGKNNPYLPLFRQYFKGTITTF